MITYILTVPVFNPNRRVSETNDNLVSFYPHLYSWKQVNSIR